MISVSKKFKDAKRRDFYITAQCTLSDSTVLDLKRDDFYISGNSIVDSSDSSDFPLGCAIEKTATLSLVNDDDRFSEYNFNAARFALTLNLDFDDGTSEKIRKGTFIVLKKPATAGRISMTLADRMYYADRTYTTKLLFPTTAGEMLRDCCQTCGIQLGDATFTNDDFVINEAPSNTTHRALIGYIAMLAGGNARIDEEDKLRIIQFQSEVFANTIYDGGTFRPWTKGEELDGGTFNPWTTGTTIDSGTFADMDKYHLLYKINSLQVDTDDVVVTGVKTTVDEVDYTYGSEGYVVKIENPLISGHVQEGVDTIGAQVVGLTMRPFSCSHVADPTATFLDPVYVVDIKQNVYQSYLTNIEFAFNGNTKFSNTAKSAEEEGVEYYSGNSTAVEQAKKNAEKMLDQYDITVRNMNELAANLFGYYSTAFVNEDGSRIDYWHDKPELLESKTVYKKGIDGFFVTQDYQGTDEATSTAGKWKAGFTANGDATLNILYAIGIMAEWINTRGLTARDNDGKITFRVDPETGAVDIVAKSFSLTSGDTIEDIAEKAADGKNKTFTSTPVPPYHVGDLWYGGTSSDVMVCTRERLTGEYNSNDWSKRDRYIDRSTASSAASSAASTAVSNAMTQQNIFNKLTNNGEEQGLYLQNGKIYLNLEYLATKIIADALGKSSWSLATGEFTSKSANGREWTKIFESIISSGYDSTQDGLLDLSAQYPNMRNVVLEAITGMLLLKAKSGVEIGTTLSVTDKATVSSLDVGVNGATFNGATTFKKSVTHSGTTTFNNTATFGSTATFNGTTNLTGTTHNGAATFNDSVILSNSKDLRVGTYRGINGTYLIDGWNMHFANGILVEMTSMFE